MRRWLAPALLTVVGIAIAARGVRAGEPLAAVVGGLALVVAFSLSPWAYPRSTGRGEADRRSADDGAPVIYWRPGCPYCARLRAGLGRRAARAHWVDIWADPEAAAALRRLTGGDEVVPTVVVRGAPHINPEVRWVRAQLRR